MRTDIGFSRPADYPEIPSGRQRPDCTVVSVAIACKVPYAPVRDFMRARTLKVKGITRWNGRCSLETWYSAMWEFGAKFQKVCLPGAYPTVRRVVDEAMVHDSRYIIYYGGLRGHIAVCRKVKGGHLMIVDQKGVRAATPNTLRKRVSGLWRISD